VEYSRIFSWGDDCDRMFCLLPDVRAVAMRQRRQSRPWLSALLQEFATGRAVRRAYFNLSRNRGICPIWRRAIDQGTPPTSHDDAQGARRNEGEEFAQPPRRQMSQRQSRTRGVFRGVVVPRSPSTVPARRGGGASPGRTPVERWEAQH
jgi:hypothetical protein